MQPIVWRTKGENPGAYDTRWGEVGGEDRFRIDAKYLGVEADLWVAEDLATGAKSDEMPFTGCVDWCWARVSGEPD
jgi:hypothetical protein